MAIHLLVCKGNEMGKQRSLEVGNEQRELEAEVLIGYEEVRWVHLVIPLSEVREFES